MGRHGYVDEIEDQLELGRWRGMVASALRGRRGQAFLRRLRAALDAMPEKRLISGEIGDYEYALQNEKGEVCTLGAYAVSQGKDPRELDAENHPQLGYLFDVASCLIQEIEWENDDAFFNYKKAADGPAERWKYMRRWVENRIIEEGRA